MISMVILHPIKMLGKGLGMMFHRATQAISGRNSLVQWLQRRINNLENRAFPAVQGSPARARVLHSILELVQFSRQIQ